MRPPRGVGVVAHLRWVVVGHRGGPRGAASARTPPHSAHALLFASEKDALSPRRSCGCGRGGRGAGAGASAVSMRKCYSLVWRTALGELEQGRSPREAFALPGVILLQRGLPWVGVSLRLSVARCAASGSAERYAAPAARFLNPCQSDTYLVRPLFWRRNRRMDAPKLAWAASASRPSRPPRPIPAAIFRFRSRRASCTPSDDAWRAPSAATRRLRAYILAMLASLSTLFLPLPPITSRRFTSPSPPRRPVTSWLMP
jgi:hypothetical protein